jgi:hypothetical protein
MSKQQTAVVNGFNLIKEIQSQQKKFLKSKK